MASYFTSTSLIESVKRSGHIPQSQVTFSDSDLLAFANEEIRTGLVPLILQYHEEFLTYVIDVPLVAGQRSYPIPDRAVGGKFRTLFHKDSNGTIHEMARIFPEDEVYYRNRANNSTASAYYLENGNIVLVNDVTSSVGSLQVRIFMRPNELVTSTNVGIITAIDTVSGTITLDNLPSSFSLSAPLDLIEQGRLHKWKAINLVPTSVNSTYKTLTFSPSSIPSDLAVGDHVALAGQTLIPQVPDDLHPILAQKVVCRVLSSQGDNTNLQFAQAILAKMESTMGNLIDNRTEGNPQKAVNLRGPLRAGKIRRRDSSY